MKCGKNRDRKRATVERIETSASGLIGEIGPGLAIQDPGPPVKTDSPLSIGLAGKYNGKSFRLTGRAQMRHALGGVWDEWYAAFSDNKWGWLAEAQGRFYMSFEEPLKELPDFNSLVVGERAPK